MAREGSEFRRAIQQVVPTMVYWCVGHQGSEIEVRAGKRVKQIEVFRRGGSRY